MPSFVVIDVVLGGYSILTKWVNSWEGGEKEACGFIRFVVTFRRSVKIIREKSARSFKAAGGGDRVTWVMRGRDGLVTKPCCSIKLVDEGEVEVLSTGRQK